MFDEFWGIDGRMYKEAWEMNQKKLQVGWYFRSQC
jgi:hypothetical protein